MLDSSYEMVPKWKKDISGLWVKRFIDFLLKNFNIKYDKVLDIGCGRGEYLQEFRKRGAKVYGIDTDPFLISVCKKKKIPIKKLDLETDKFPFKDKFFDLAICSNVLEHLYNPHNLLNEVNRVLDGTFIIMAPNWRYCYKSFFDYGHVKPYTEKALKTLLLVHEFKIIKIYPRFGHIKFLWIYFDWAWGRSFFTPFKRNTKLLGIATNLESNNIKR